MSVFQTPKDFVWEGSYMDDEEGLAVLTIAKDEKNKKKYKCTVNVPDENITHIDTYEFTAVSGKDAGLSYDDGVRTTYEIPDFEKNPDAHVSSTVAYEDGTGEIYYLNGRLYWIDDKDDSGSGLAFSRQEEAAVEETTEDDDIEGNSSEDSSGDNASGQKKSRKKKSGKKKSKKTKSQKEESVVDVLEQ